MSYEIPGQTRSYETTEDLSGSYLCFVKRVGGILTKVTSAGDSAVGVLQNKPGRPGIGVFQGGERSAATVMIDGVTRARAGEAFASDVALTFDDSGRVVAADDGDRIVGQAEQASTGANAVVAVLLKPLGGLAVVPNDGF